MEPEKGSAFRFVIPLGIMVVQKTTEDAESEDAGCLTDRLIQITKVDDEVQQAVLVVEDDPANMRLTADILEAGGYRMLKAYSAEEGIRIAESESPALILMDISLPGMDGLTATRVLKQQVSTARIPVVALTAHAMKDDESKAREAGCDAYLTKPANTSTFYRIVENFVNAGKSESET
jgi:two-component system, cell cycle response regulator DivK